MIGKLSGIIDSFGEGYLILDVAGVGYVVFASSRTLGSIGQVGDTASLLIHTQVREDAITLYGFGSAAEQYWFKTLTSVQGVGSKVGLSILAACPPEEIGFILASQDKAALTRADGVGPKLAARILTELKDKAGPVELFELPKGAKQGTAKPLTGATVEQDAVSALTNLGYANAEAYRAVMAAKAKANDNDDLEGLIKQALKELMA
jgi:holliday junction DNA helicase RuvA